MRERDTFPVTHSVCDCEALGRQLAVTYGVEGLMTCQFLRRGFHDTYLLSALDGSYVARVYRTQRTRSEIAYELGLLRHLVARGVSVSGPVPDVDGGWMRVLDAPEGQRCVALFTHASGRALVWNCGESALAGRLLAAIHQDSGDYVSQHERAPLDAAHLVDAPLRALRPFLVAQSCELSDLERVAQALRSELAARQGQLEWGPCHGDFNAGNLHIAEDRSLTAFDFDFCGPGWRAYDFVGAWRWAGWSDAGIWKAFVAGYRGVRPIADADLDAVSLFDGISRFRSLGLSATNAACRGSLPVVGHKLQRQLGALRAWERDYLGGRLDPRPARSRGSPTPAVVSWT
jgi:Ser/Thr protein kinase RdoA (MazF antagonist)